MHTIPYRQKGEELGDACKKLCQSCYKYKIAPLQIYTTTRKQYDLEE